MKKEKTRKKKKYADKDEKWRVVIVFDDDTTGKATNIVIFKFAVKPKKKEIDDLVAKIQGEL